MTRHFDCKVRALHCVELLQSWSTSLITYYFRCNVNNMVSDVQWCDNSTLVKQAALTPLANCQVCRSEKKKQKQKTRKNSYLDTRIV